MEEASIGAGADLIDDIRLEIGIDGARDVFAVAYRDDYQRQPCVTGCIYLPVSEKKVEKPSSGSAALRSSVKYPSG